MAIQHSNSSSSLADILERILDKGIVIAGDIKISLADVELLTIKIRLLVASVDKAKEMGIDWWQHDPYLSSQAHVSPALAVPKETAKLDVSEKSSKQQSLNVLNELIPKEELDLKAEANVFENKIMASYERTKPEAVIIDAIPLNNDSVNFNSTAEKLNSKLKEGKSSSLGKPSVGRSIERIPR